MYPPQVRWSTVVLNSEVADHVMDPMAPELPEIDQEAAWLAASVVDQERWVWKSCNLDNYGKIMGLLSD